MTLPFRDKDRPARHTTRLGIFLWAALISALAGMVQFFEPLEDIYRGGRNYLHERPADGKTVVVGVDDKSIAAFGTAHYSRAYDARLVDELFRLGARRVYFDRVFADVGDPAGDNQFKDALARHRGRVFLGGTHSLDPVSRKFQDVLPIPLFRQVADIRSLDGASTPFSLSAELVLSKKLSGKTVRSVSADIAGVSANSGTSYRPDWTVQIGTVPTASYIDIISGKANGFPIRDHDVLIGNTSILSNDIFQVVSQGWFPGVYIHAVGAQTLREGKPSSLGWFPSWLVAACFSILALRIRSVRASRVILASAALCALIAPFVLDMRFITADFLPAYLLFAIVSYRSLAMRSLDRVRLQNAATLMPNLAALREERLAGVRPIVAMRIRNYAAINASFTDSVEDELIGEIVRRLTLPGTSTTFYQGEDVLYWLGPALPHKELEGHIAGLGRMIESQFVVRGRKLDIHVAFGIDNDQARSITSRIGRALQAADNAAAKHHALAFNTSGNDDDTAWELSLMSELDAAIDAGNIWVAYQPQFSLTDNSITGVEALVRWQHPTRGAISPEAFIGPAEAHNRMLRLTLYVLQQATTACRSIVEANPQFRLGVNLSASLLEHPGLPEKVHQALFITGFPAANLTLEVTESAPFSEHQAVTGNLAQLADQGIELSIDDYGTGNATLEYLRTLPCNEIKIDRRFVAGLADSSSDRLMVESTIGLAHGLGRRVIAEGIEDLATLIRLRQAGCDIAQGYFLAKPMRIDALKTLIKEESSARVA